MDGKNIEIESNPVNNSGLGGQNNPEFQEPDKLLEALERLYNAVDLTRTNRINASNRLLKTEHFVQAINIYYSCVAAIVTVLSLMYPEKNYSIAYDGTPCGECL